MGNELQAQFGPAGSETRHQAARQARAATFIPIIREKLLAYPDITPQARQTLIWAVECFFVTGKSLAISFKDHPELGAAISHSVPEIMSELSDFCVDKGIPFYMARGIGRLTGEEMHSLGNPLNTGRFAILTLTNQPVLGIPEDALRIDPDMHAISTIDLERTPATAAPTPA